ncbi:DUF1566 domain-containing protein [bacterium]|nr:DUF1566 domain-containing protein [bacterium]
MLLLSENFVNQESREDKESGFKFSSSQEEYFNCKKLDENGIVWREATDYEKNKFQSVIFQWKDTKWENSKRCVNGKELFFTDKSTGLTWSSKSKHINLKEAVSYCKKLNEGGFNDWRLPTISELRTLIQNCPATQTGGKCKVTDKCLYYDCRNDACRGCDDSDSSGKYSKLGDTSSLWSDTQWRVGFSTGRLSREPWGYVFDVRCVRK